ncbi:MAG: hypothetical protein GKR89_29815 [Candidatus Latescibacteria bacterium]|nr:hypothetical protein [Candidatus Latescibacterota bacterium]
MINFPILRRHTIRSLLSAFVVVALFSGCGATVDETGPRRIMYWEKWSGFEGEAAQKVVAAFNKKERRKAELTALPSIPMSTKALCSI